MTVTINTIDGRSHTTHTDQESLERLLRGVATVGAILQINADKTVQTYIVAGTISSITTSK